MEEIWKDIAGFEGSYQVSNLGNVRSLDRVRPHHRAKSGFKRLKGKLLTARRSPDGYATYLLYTGSGKKDCEQLGGHRLVLSTFAPVEGWEDLFVNHIDGNPSNNTLSNLEWSTCKENNNHATQVLKKGACHRRARDIRITSPDGTVVVINGGRNAAQHIGVKYTSRVPRAASKQGFINGYLLEYVSEGDSTIKPPIATACLLLHNEDENRSMLFRSKSKAAEYLGVSKQSVSAAIRRSGSVGGVWQVHSLA